MSMNGHPCEDDMIGIDPKHTALPLDAKGKKFWKRIHETMSGWEQTPIKVDIHSRPPDIHPTRPPDITDSTNDPMVVAIKAMVDAGLPKDKIADAVSLIAGKTPVCPPDVHPTSTRLDQIEARRKWDREYKRRKRAEKAKGDVNTESEKRPPDSEMRDIYIEDKNTPKEEDKKVSKKAIKYETDFENFWRAYPRTPTMGKSETYKVWKKIGVEERQLAGGAVPKYVAWLKTQKADYPVIHACRFLSKKRFEGFQEAPKAAFGPSTPPWEWEGMTEEAWFKRERAKHNGQG